MESGQQRGPLPSGELAVTPGIAGRRNQAWGPFWPHSALRLRFSADSLLKSALISLLLAMTFLVCCWKSLVVPAADIWPAVSLVGALLTLAAYYRHRGETSFVLCLTALAQIVGFASCYVVAMYALTTISCPLVDGRLATFDAWCGVRVPDAVNWANEHPTAGILLRLAYDSLLYQTAAVVMLLGLRGQRQYLESFVLTFMLAAVLALALYVVMPACGPFVEYGMTASADQERFLDHFFSLRDGSRAVISYRGAEGLITFPSFHVAWGLLMVWAVRANRIALLGFAVLNVMLVISTMTTGWHYLADVLGGAAVAAIAIFCANACRLRSGLADRC